MSMLTKEELFIYHDNILNKYTSLYLREQVPDELWNMYVSILWSCCGNGNLHLFAHDIHCMHLSIMSLG